MSEVIHYHETVKPICVPPSSYWSLCITFASFCFSKLLQIIIRMWLFSSLSSACHTLSTYCRSFGHTGSWSIVLVVVAAVAAFAPELAFLWSSHECGVEGYVKMPMDLPGNSMCLPSNVVMRSSFDPFIPLIFAPIIVACSGLVLSSFGFSYYQQPERIV